MLYWIPYAFVRMSVFLIAGIVLGIFYPDLIAPSITICVLLLLVLSYFSVYILNRKKRKLIINPGLFGLAAIFFGGYLSVQFNTESNYPDHISNSGETVLFYKAVIDGYGQEKEKVWKEVLQVQQVKQGDLWRPASGKVLLYLPKKDFPATFNYGDILLIKGSPQIVSPPSNPGEFDYKTFLAYKNITHQQFVSRDDVLMIGNKPRSKTLALSIDLRNWAEAKLKAVVSGEREQAIACALILGVTDGLDNELMGAYAATGAMHVLSVSGLHVGILYLLIMILLRPLLKIDHGKWLVAGISLFILWIYACVTGLSPSVLRAVTMFSFMVLARPLNHRTNIYNVLAASAFCLLLFDPYLIMSVGFQLSYLAVLGIVYLQPLLYNLFEPQSRMVDEVWKISSVSIAAQLATFPLGLLYFHQFPNYFLLSNLFVLPLGFAVLVGGLSTLAFSFISSLATLFGILLQWLIKLLNYLIFLTDSLPFNVIENIRISFFQCILLMVFLTVTILFVQQRKIIFFYAGSIFLVVFSILSWINYYSNASDSRFTVYKVAGTSVYDLMESGNAFFYSDTLLAVDESKVSFHIRPNRELHYVTRVHPGDTQQFTKTFSFGRITLWNGKSIVQLTSAEYNLPADLQVDFLVLSHNSVKELESILSKIKCDQVIVDSSNSLKLANKLLMEAKTKNYRVHSILHEGAFDKTI
jgi:competence protein ComEC